MNYEKEKNEDVHEQKESMKSAHLHTMRKINTFLEIQASSNPLTAEEIKKLKAKRPGFYSFIP